MLQICKSFLDVEDETHFIFGIKNMGIEIESAITAVFINDSTSRFIFCFHVGSPNFETQLDLFHYEILIMEKQSQNSDIKNEEQEVKPIVFPEGSIDLHHSEITLTTCSLFISIKIHHEDGFYYEVYFRDSTIFSSI